MKVTILGAGCCQYETDYAPSSHHIQAGNTSVLLDAGPGVTGRLLQNNIDPHDLDVVLVSHEHVDHSAGLADLFQAIFVRTRFHADLPRARRADKPLTIVGFKGVQNYVNIAAQWALIEEDSLKLNVVELGQGDVWQTSEVGNDLRVEAFQVPHTPTSIGFRVETEGKAIGYTGDTETAPVLDDIMRDADLVIANTAMPPSDDPEVKRLDPKMAAQHAAQAGTKRLALVHFYPELVEAIDKIEGWVRESYQGELVIGKDNTTLEV
ncbi:MAG: ribonuclease Z [Candidatus Doudnabacteria bacterium]|nr:ribonuclease Z [Candidatus Doudnabacteria bacterium]MCA9387482.1 ribonuclease Z [Candidatus Andersenbacteria bacterium]